MIWIRGNAARQHLFNGIPLSRGDLRHKGRDHVTKSFTQVSRHATPRAPTLTIVHTTLVVFYMGNLGLDLCKSSYILSPSHC